MQRYYYETIMLEFDSHLQQFIQTAAGAGLRAKMEYHLGWRDESLQEVKRNTGKRGRPALCLLSSLLFSRDYHRSFPVAAALEILHNFSLVFDDVQDLDPMRRGKPSVWSLWGVDEAINVGSAMQTLVHKSLFEMLRFERAEMVLEMCDYISTVKMELCEGQQLDIELAKSRSHIKLPEYLEMIRKKTAVLFEAAAHLGSVCGGTDVNNISKCKNFGRNFGMAFQLFDDAAGIWGDQEKGFDKCASDLANRKKTYPVIYTYVSCSNETEEALIEKYFTASMLTPDDLKEIEELMREKNALQATLDLGERYLQEALQSLGHVQGDQTVKLLIEKWAREIVAKQVSVLHLSEEHLHSFTAKA